ncbi:unnamed protein product [Allacma fusca]|uniref:Uncharacterized protein n=1 Tax=Allacma fusca TaxID=39272 RepID=A0A8J2JLW4_9HEXA|nr:unnamed protein product [Allacma fusca]
MPLGGNPAEPESNNVERETPSVDRFIGFGSNSSSQILDVTSKEISNARKSVSSTETCTELSSTCRNAYATKTGLSESDLLDIQGHAAVARSIKSRLKNILFWLPFQPKLVTVQTVHLFGNSKTSTIASSNHHLSTTSRSRTSPKVRFSPDVLEQYKMKGDVAGKERSVKRTTKKPRNTPKKVVDDDGRIIYNPTECDSDSNSDTSVNIYDCEPCCLRKRHYPETMTIQPVLSLNYRVQVENFMDSLETAGYYLEGNTKTIDGALEPFRLSLKHPLTSNGNNLAAKIWLFTYSLRTVFGTREKPTLPEFDNLLKQFQLLGKECEKTCIYMRTFESRFDDFDKKVLQFVSKTAGRFKMKLNVDMYRVKERGSYQRKVLELSQRKIPEENLLIQFRGDWYENESQWDDFARYALHFKIKILLGLVDEVLRGLQVVQSQMRFLLEDVVAGKFEAEDRHIFKVLELMDKVINFFLTSVETTATHERELRQVIRTFAKDTIDFVRKTNFTIWKVFELRDTTQLCFTYITQTYKNTCNFEDYRPTAIYTNTSSKFLFCGDWKLNRFLFQPEDFYRADFRRTLQMFYVSSSKCQFILKHLPGNLPPLNLGPIMTNWTTFSIPLKPIVTLPPINANKYTLFYSSTIFGTEKSSD